VRQTGVTPAINYELLCPGCALLTVGHREPAQACQRCGRELQPTADVPAYLSDKDCHTFIDPELSTPPRRTPHRE